MNVLMKKYLTLYFVCAGVVLFTNSLSAQDIRSDVSGFYANITLNGGTWNTSSSFLSNFRDLDPNSIGVQLSGGYGFGQRLEGFAQLSVSNFNMSGDWDTYSHTQLGLGFRYNFGATLMRLRPFADVQLSSSSVEIDRAFIITQGGQRLEGALELEGMAVILGGGFRYFFKPWMAANLHLRYHMGTDYSTNIDGIELSVEEDLDFNQFDIGAGFTWYFGNKF